jgi:hypothetical protein
MSPKKHFFGGTGIRGPTQKWGMEILVQRLESSTAHALQWEEMRVRRQGGYSTSVGVSPKVWGGTNCNIFVISSAGSHRMGDRIPFHSWMLASGLSHSWTRCAMAAGILLIGRCLGACKIQGSLGPLALLSSRKDRVTLSCSLINSALPAGKLSMWTVFHTDK